MTSWSPMQLKIYICCSVGDIGFFFLKNSELLKAQEIIINLDRTCMYVKLVSKWWHFSDKMWFLHVHTIIF